MLAACVADVPPKFEEVNACHGSRCDGPSTTSSVTRPPPPVGPAPWGIDNPPRGRDLGGTNILVVTGLDVDGPMRQGVRWGDDDGEWDARLVDSVLRIWSTHRVNFRERVTVFLDIDLATNPPTVMRGALTSMYSDSRSMTEFLSSGVLELQSADDRMVIGRWRGFAEDLSFVIELESAQS